MSYMSIDIDKDDYTLVQRIIEKTKRFCGIKHYVINNSTLKGYHIKFLCTKRECEACRLVFDDVLRFERDYTNRPFHERNVLFFSKRIAKCGKILSL